MWKMETREGEEREKKRDQEGMEKRGRMKDGS